MKQLMSNKDYHAHPAFGSTTLKKIASKSVLHYLFDEFKESDATIIGSAVHAKILEPETFDSEFAVAPQCDRRTKAGKELWASFCEYADGKTIIKEESSETILACVDSILSHPVASNMLKGGLGEYSYFVKDEETGLDLKCRPDYFLNDSLIDIKTCQDASPKGFTRAVVNMGYHLQAAFYLDVFNKANQTNIKEFYFIACETSAPFATAIYKLDEFAIEEGRGLYKQALRDLHEYLKLGAEKSTRLHNFAYGTEIKSLEIPNWAYTGA